MIDFSTQIRDGVAVVTGASDGLGKALAMGLLAEGLTVAGIARRADALAAVTADAPAGKFHPITADVADPDAVRAAFDAIRQDAGPVTILINNAAVFPHRDILEESAESFMQTVAVNLGGPFACSRAALDDMIAQGFGRIINVGSFAGIAPAPAAAAYSVSKGAAHVLSRAWVAELDERFPDIVISEWMPGILNTKMGLPDGISPELAASRGVRLALWHDRALNGVVFDGDRSIMPPMGWKRKLLNKVLRQSPKPFILD